MPYVAVASSPMATISVLKPCLPATSTATAFVTRCSALPYLPSRLSASSGRFSGTLLELNQVIFSIIWDNMWISFTSFYANQLHLQCGGLPVRVVFVCSLLCIFSHWRILSSKWRKFRGQSFFCLNFFKSLTF